MYVDEDKRKIYGSDYKNIVKIHTDDLPREGQCFINSIISNIKIIVPQ